MEEVVLEQCAQALPGQVLGISKDKPFKQLFQYLATIMIYQIIFKCLFVLLQFSTFQIVSFLLSHLWGPLTSLAASEGWHSFHLHGRWLYTEMVPLLSCFFLRLEKLSALSLLVVYCCPWNFLVRFSLHVQWRQYLLNRGNKREARIKKSETGR